MLQLQTLWLTANNIHGTLPEEWGRPDVFQNLSLLYLDNNQLTGEHAPVALHQLIWPCIPEVQDKIWSEIECEVRTCSTGDAAPDGGVCPAC